RLSRSSEPAFPRSGRARSRRRRHARPPELLRRGGWRASRREDKAERVRSVEPIGDLAEEIERALRFEPRLPAEQLAKIDSVDITHREVQDAPKRSRFPTS